MRLFVKRILLMLLLVTVLLCVVIATKIVRRQNLVMKTMAVEMGQNVLMIGDSHIGCTFVEDAKYSNKIVWRSSMPQQFTWMRMRDMERIGVLKNVDTLILDIGLQSFGQQSHERMMELWWRMIPISWRYPNVLPLTVMDRMKYMLSNINGRIKVSERMPTNNISIITRTAEEKARDFQHISDTHFAWVDHPEEMCVGWQISPKKAIAGIADICRRNNIRMVFFSAPVTSYYRQAIPEQAERTLCEFTDYISSLGIEYYDLRSWGDDGLFCDCFHFTLDGARVFTEWFYKEKLHRKLVAKNVGK